MNPPAKTSNSPADDADPAFVRLRKRRLRRHLALWAGLLVFTLGLYIGSYAWWFKPGVQDGSLLRSYAAGRFETWRAMFFSPLAERDYQRQARRSRDYLEDEWVEANWLSLDAPEPVQDGVRLRVQWLHRQQETYGWPLVHCEFRKPRPLKEPRMPPGSEPRDLSLTLAQSDWLTSIFRREKGSPEDVAAIVYNMLGQEMSSAHPGFLTETEFHSPDRNPNFYTGPEPVYTQIRIYLWPRGHTSSGKGLPTGLPARDWDRLVIIAGDSPTSEVHILARKRDLPPSPE